MCTPYVGLCLGQGLPFANPVRYCTQVLHTAMFWVCHTRAGQLPAQVLGGQAKVAIVHVAHACDLIADQTMCVKVVLRACSVSMSS